MLRLPLAALVLLAATPSQALVRLDFATAFFNAPEYGSEDFEPGLGTSGRSLSINDIGGCEGSDETGERCGAYEDSSFTLTLTDSGFAYTAGLRQDHAIASTALATDILVLATFRADREMYLDPHELRGVNLPFCLSCSHNFWSNIRQEQEADGSWLAIIEVGTSAATYEGIQQVGHQLTVNLAEVPEPQAWAMLIAGFGLVGAAQRRRRAFGAA